STPLLVRLAPTDSTCVVTVPAAPVRNVPLLPMVTLLPTVSVRATAVSHCSTEAAPPVPTVTVSATAAVSMVTVAPFTMVTLSVLAGRTPPTHVAVELHSPPAAVELTLPPAVVVWLPLRGVLVPPSEMANTRQKYVVLGRSAVPL